MHREKSEQTGLEFFLKQGFHIGESSVVYDLRKYWSTLVLSLDQEATSKINTVIKKKEQKTK